MFNSQFNTRSFSTGSLNNNNNTIRGTYEPFRETRHFDTDGVYKKIMSISAMPQYKTLSFEELRHQDYTLGNNKKNTTSSLTTINRDLGSTYSSNFMNNSSNSYTQGPKFSITRVSDDGYIRSNSICITSMDYYKNKSFEELRAEHYNSKNSNNTQNNAFGNNSFLNNTGTNSVVNTSSGYNFGVNMFSKPSAPLATTTQPQFSFLNNNNNNTQVPSTSAFGLNPSTTTNTTSSSLFSNTTGNTLFNKPSNTTTSAFGFGNTNKPNLSLFPQTNTQSTNTAPTFNNNNTSFSMLSGQNAQPNNNTSSFSNTGNTLGGNTFGNLFNYNTNQQQPFTLSANKNNDNFNLQQLQQNNNNNNNNQVEKNETRKVCATIEDSLLLYPYNKDPNLLPF